MSEYREGDMVALKIPKGQLEFVRKNPKAAQMIGSVIVSISQLRRSIAEAEKVFDNPQIFEGYLENSSKEELAQFLQDVKISQKETLELGKVDTNSFRQIQEQMGDSMVSTEIIVGDKNLN